MLTIFTYIFIFILGTVFGSMINVLIYRLPLEEDVVVKPSHCMNCGARLKPYDLIPIFSYIFLRGKCRHCGEKISIQYPLIEMLTGLVFVGIFYLFGWNIEPVALIQMIPSYDVFNLFAIFLLSVIFLAIFFIDLRHYIIPNELIVVGLISGLVFAVLKSVSFMWSGFNIIQPIAFKWSILLDALYGSLIGAGAFVGIMLLGEWMFKKEAMGMGDVKLMAVVGLFLGFKLTVLSMFLAFVVGSIISVFLLATKIKSREDMVPFGPFIIVGSMLALVWGEQILTWYFGLAKL